jgi:hypothetical protein
MRSAGGLSNFLNTFRPSHDSGHNASSRELQAAAAVYIVWNLRKGTSADRRAVCGQGKIRDTGSLGNISAITVVDFERSG